MRSTRSIALSRGSGLQGRWVRNARAAGWVELRRGRRNERLSVSELDADAAVPVLQEYYRVGRVTRPFFTVTLASPKDEWLVEASRHPVFELLAS